MTQAPTTPVKTVGGDKLPTNTDAPDVKHGAPEADAESNPSTTEAVVTK